MVVQGHLSYVGTMQQTPHPGSDSIFARLSRFALCIAPSSSHAYDALEAVTPLASGGEELILREAFRQLLSHLDAVQDDAVSYMGLPPRSIVARFSFLPYHQRVAFALVVIEEFEIADAAEIMGLDEEDVRVLLLATRDFLFTSRLTERADA
ncbi:hypothetical protein [Parvularcula lutaonensis]|uniref:hypothetical protein n=1 Tax=Parvularcula lutaonensis TaxID=491923 RepID=UPI001678AC39|nr:hypothetical protein [Parvularcula lutaonensis]